MSITVGGYSFDGPYTSTGSIRDESGVYVIHDHNNGKYFIVDVGESSEIKSRVDSHDRKDCWEQVKKGDLTISALYVNEEQRLKIAKEIRGKYNIPCGEQ